MSVSIVYSSKTGNTARLARAIRDRLPDGQCAYFGAPPGAVAKKGPLFVGFWTDKGGCDEASAAFLRTLSGREVALFGTAGFGGSEEYFSGILGRARALLPQGNVYLGGFLCQGRMPDGVRARYEGLLALHPDDPKLKGMLENFDRALSHPDEADLRAVGAFALRMLGA